MIKPRIGGHPIHIMLTHFPTAFFPMAAVCSSIYYYTENNITGHVAFYCMAAGVLTAAFAIIFGLWESLLVPLHKTKIIITIIWHATLNGIVTIMFLIWTIKAWKIYPELIKDSTLIIILKWIVIILLFAGNYFGGKLLLKYHVGINKTKNNEFKIF